MLQSSYLDQDFAFHAAGLKWLSLSTLVSCQAPFVIRNGELRRIRLDCHTQNRRGPLKVINTPISSHDKQMWYLFSWKWYEWRLSAFLYFCASPDLVHFLLGEKAAAKASSFQTHNIKGRRKKKEKKTVFEVASHLYTIISWQNVQ